MRCTKSCVFLNILQLFSAIHVNAAGYDSSTAVSYAHRYAFDYNPAYSNYNSIGGDCANFVSQCLRAGGLEMTDGWYWYSYDERSTSWASCSNMYNYFKNAGYTIIENPSDDELYDGNPVLYYSSSKGRWSHAAICVGHDGSGNALVSAHNNDHDSVNWRLGDSWSKRCTIMINNGIIPEPPPMPHPQISKDLYSADETVDVTWNPTANTTHYWLHPLIKTVFIMRAKAAMTRIRLCAGSDRLSGSFCDPVSHLLVLWSARTGFPLSRSPKSRHSCIPPDRR